MASTQPYTDAHAIVWMEVGVVLRDALLDDERAILVKAVSENLRDKSFVDADGDCEKDESLILALELPDNEGEIVELLHIHDTHIHYMAYEYRGWEVTKEIALNRIEPVLQFMSRRPKEAKPARLILAFKDAFRSDEPENYSAHEVFKPNEFMPSAIFNCKEFWYHQLTLMREAPSDFSNIWKRIFSRTIIDARVLNVEDSTVHSTEITHRQQMQGNQDDGPDVEWGKDAVQSKLDIMHTANKSLMVALLNDEMSVRIGLKESTK